ncbi:MAG: ABC transporter ATP-binding protein [Planctomycetes bacterium]|nr:ABC transporter ATP-binding protein [Planctomycetota bacterium]
MSVPIRIVNVVKTFGRVRAVDNVSLETEPGELYFLLGPSGCGKTTLLRAVAGLADIDSGDIYLGDRRITDVPPHRRNTAMVFQNYALWPHMTVLENVAFGLEIRGLGRSERRRRAGQALETVQMGHLGDRKPNQLSGGQQQRVALARALAIEPDCLLLDEPLSNLDAKLRLEMRSEIRRVHRETGLTILYVTHDQKEALSLADRVALMRDGRVEQVGPPRELYHQPASRFAAEFLGETNVLPGRVRAVTDGAAEIACPFATLKVRGCGGLATERSCEVLVRPEAVAVVPSNVIRPTNGMAAKVLDVTFLGELEQIIVAVADGPELKALHVPQPAKAVRPGDAVWASFRPEDAVVFAADEPSSQSEA